MDELSAFEVSLGSAQSAHLSIEVRGYEHPEVAEPHGFDLLDCRIRVNADPVRASFPFSLRVGELAEVRAYLAEINSGNGPPAGFVMAGGTFNISFAPSRRGPVLCAVLLKSIDVSHVRLEFMITLEPEDISRALAGFSSLPPAL